MSEPRLEVRDGRGRHWVPVSKAPFAIGRRKANDLSLSAPDISKDHAEIVRDGERYVLRDLRSRFGTFVNGQPISEHALRDGDVIRLARGTGMELVFLEGQPSRTPPPSTGTPIDELRQMSVLLEGLRAFSAGPVLDDVLALVVDAAIDMSGAERGFVMLPNPASGLEFKIGRARGRVTLPGRSFQTSRKIPEEVFATGRSKVIADLPVEDIDNVHADTKLINIRHVVCMPLKAVRCVEERAAIRQEPTNIGVLYLDSCERGHLLSRAARSALETLAAEAAIAIENARLYREACEKARLEDELRIASGIQQRLVPRHRRRGGHYDAVGATLPCRAIGGDFFDYLELPDGGFGFALADIAGKGPAAALLTAMIQGAFMAHAKAAGCGPASTLSHLNRDLFERGIEARYATMLYGVLGPEGQLRYSNAGHNPPLLVQRGGVVRLDKGGMPVGLFWTTVYDEDTVTLAPGDLLVLYSDGVAEALDVGGQEFGEARILASVLENREAEPPAVLEALMHAVKAFTAGAPQSDDVTAVVIRYTGTASAR